MRYALYNAAWRLAAPYVRSRLNAKPDEHGLLERFQPVLPQLGPAPIWVHACSVGEVNTAKPLLDALSARHGEACILLTASTTTGRARAQAIHQGPSAYLPFDHPASVNRFLDQVKPAVLVLIETELWPNVLRECARRSIPVLVVNARLSDKHFARYAKWRSLAGGMFASLSMVGAQTITYAQRFESMGVPRDKVQVTGNLKFDAAVTEVPMAQRARIRAACGIPDSAPVLIFGSTRPGDEALASACWATLREEVPGLYLVIAPRHVDRRDEILAQFGEPVLLRSEVLDGRLPSGERVVLVDTLGELTQFYAASSLAVIGGSFYPGVEGHNPIEPAGLGVPPIFGPYMGNFPEAVEALMQADAAVQVHCPEDLYGAISAELRDPASLRHRGTRSRRVVLENQGATHRNIALIEACLERVAPG